MGKVTRRNMMAGVAGVSLAGMSAKSYARVSGANDRIHVAVMGLHGRGSGLMGAFARAANTRVHTMCDVDANILDQRAGEFVAKGFDKPNLEGDFRKALDDKDVDVLVITAPDHWHVPAALAALKAGKHVYVEKPCSHTPQEGELLIAAQKKYRKIVQMGNQQRSSKESQELAMLVHEGAIGDPYEAYTWYANNRGTIGTGSHVPPPANLDWELWQGPAPRRAYKDNIVHYNWHWRWHWGTGETCNNALHEIDIARWLMKLDHPEKVEFDAARRFYRDDWEMYDTMDLRLTYPGGVNVTWEGHSCNNVRKFGKGRGTIVYGTKGSAFVDRQGYEIFDLAGKSLRRNMRTDAVDGTNTVGESFLDDLHIANFHGLIRGTETKQSSPITEGHISTLACHLGNIAYRTGRALTCDPRTGRILNDDEAMTYWDKPYEPGWELSV